MANEDEGSKPGQQQPEDERKFSQQQYDLLKSFSKKGEEGIKEWNNWRKEHTDEEIWLQGVDLEAAYLEQADLSRAHLEKAVLSYAHIEYAVLSRAHLEHTVLWGVFFENANLIDAHLENADLSYAHLENAKLMGAHLENANFIDAHLENADLKDAHLENSKLIGANLQGAVFCNAQVQGADFSGSIVDGETLIWDCKVDNKTNFKGVGLDSARIEPETKQLLEYNIRRMNWEQWYRGKSKNKWIIKIHQLLTLPVRLFWLVSNYGLSTWRIFFTFFALAFVFAVAYWHWPNFVAFNGNPVVESFHGLWHAFYFSVVTMTTLGFGDIAANPDSWKGQGLLMLQVILGYVLLGALVTRFAVLFTAGGPAGKFSPIKTKETKKGD